MSVRRSSSSVQASGLRGGVLVGHVAQDDEVQTGADAGHRRQIDGPSLSQRVAHVIAHVQVAGRLQRGESGLRVFQLPVGEVTDAAPQGHRLRHLEQRAGRRVGVDEPPLVVEEQHGVGRSAEDGAENTLAALQLVGRQLEKVGSGAQIVSRQPRLGVLGALGRRRELRAQRLHLIFGHARVGHSHQNLLGPPG